LGRDRELAETTGGDMTSVEWVDVTPEVAAEWLLRTHVNRRTYERTVNTYSRLMMNGLWGISNDAIVFDVKDHLINGQHRLKAIIKSDVTCRFLVVQGAETTSQQVMDSGRKRTLADELTVRGESNSHMLAAALADLYRWEIGAPRNRSAYPALVEALGLLDKHSGIRDSLHYGRLAATNIRYKGGLATCLHYTFGLLDETAPEDANTFFTAVSTGVNLTEHHPIYMLRRVLEKEILALRKTPPTVIHAMTIKAWNAYRDGTEIKLLTFKPGGAKPEIWPEPH
jgi:hypothetical protein